MTELKRLWQTVPGAAKWGLKLLGSALLLGLTFRRFPIARLWPAIGGIRWNPALASVAVFVLLMTCGEAVRLWIAARLSQGEGPGPTPWQWAVHYLHSRPWVYILPASIAAEGMLWARATRSGVPASTGGRIVLGAKLWGLAAWAFAAGLGLQREPRLLNLLRGLPAWTRGGLPWYLLGAAVCLGAGAFSCVGARNGSLTMGRRALLLAASLATALAVMGVSVGCAWWAALAAGLPMSFSAIMGAAALLNFALVLPISLGGLGLQEAVLLTAFMPLGLAPGPLLALSFLMHLQRLAMVAVGLATWVQGPSL